MKTRLCLLILSGALFTCVHCDVSGGHLKWMFDANKGYAPYNSPFVPAMLRGEQVGDERVAVLSKTLNGNWAVDGLRIADGTTSHIAL